MNWRFAGISVVAVLLLLTFFPVHGQNSVEYAIQAGADGSALWVIEEAGTDIRVTPDTLTQFQNNVTALIHAAENVSHRQMSAKEFSITSTISGSYVVVQYKFLWQNFSLVENSEIKIGDVFQVTDLFLRLQGDGKVVLNYPDQYVLVTVSPVPSAQDDSHQTLMWPGTMNLVGESVSITFREKPLDLLDFIGRNSILILAVAILVAGSSAGLYLFRRRSKMRIPPASRPEGSSLSIVESDEEKIVRLLRSSRGSLHQSAIVEQCRFSKAKTSQLLAALESRGVVRREKKGRDKIVVLVERNKDGRAQ
jgi:DNA-binding MarR family transcriptional regulator